MIKLVIFDLDGTLVNTAADIRATLNASLLQFGLNPLSLESTINYVGDGAKKLVERAVGARQDLAESVYKNFSVGYANCQNNLSSLYPFEEETLQNLKDAGIMLALLTNKPQAATDRVYAKFLSKFDFCVVLGQTEYYPLKPNPASTLDILRKTCVKKEECVFVGDGEADIRCASAAGLKCISALWGFRSKEELKAAGAQIFAQNYKELYKIILGNFA